VGRRPRAHRGTARRRGRPRHRGRRARRPGRWSGRSTPTRRRRRPRCSAGTPRMPAPLRRSLRACRPPPVAPRRGRRPGAPDTRATILDAARSAFAEKGFGGHHDPGGGVDGGCRRCAGAPLLRDQGRPVPRGDGAAVRPATRDRVRPWPVARTAPGSACSARSSPSGTTRRSRRCSSGSSVLRSSRGVSDCSPGLRAGRAAAGRGGARHRSSPTSGCRW
jgi:hypothetical protein